MMKPIRKKYKNIGMAVAITFNAAILIGSMFSCNKIEKLEEKDEVVAVLDFSEAGGGSSGGSPEVSQPKESDAAPDKPVETPQEAEPETATQETESAIVSNEPSKHSEKEGEKEPNKPANNFDNLFKNSTPGPGEGPEPGKGPGIGPGPGKGPGKGPGIGPGIGDGSGRYTLSKPSIKNPVQEVGDVYIKLIIRRDGSVKSATVMSKHKKTTAVSPIQFALAKKKALQYVFNSDQTGKHDLVGLYVTIKFTLN